MKDKTVVLFFIALAFLFVVFIFSIYFNGISPLVPPQEINSKTCNLNGKKYAVGESFKSDDGCNTCSCTESLDVACTLMACEPLDNPSIKK